MQIKLSIYKAGRILIKSCQNNYSLQKIIEDKKPVRNDLEFNDYECSVKPLLFAKIKKSSKLANISVTPVSQNSQF